MRKIKTKLEGFVWELNEIIQSIEPHALSRYYIIIIRVSAELFSHVQLFATPWTVACQAPLTMGILQARILEWVAISSSRRSSWPRSPTFQADALPSEPPGKSSASKSFIIMRHGQASKFSLFRLHPIWRKINTPGSKFLTAKTCFPGPIWTTTICWPYLLQGLVMSICNNRYCPCPSMLILWTVSCLSRTPIMSHLCSKSYSFPPISG